MTHRPSASSWDPHVAAAFFSQIDPPSQWLQLFDQLPMVYLYVKDQAGRFMALNASRIAMSKLPADQLLGKTDLDLHPVYWGQQYREEDQQVMQSGQPVLGRIWLVPDAGGELGTFVSSKFPLYAGEHCVGIAGVMYRIDGDRHRDDDPLRQATEIIGRDYAESLSVRDLARRVHLSASQLTRRFQATYQMSPLQYLQRRRLHEASRLLLQTDLTIGEIAAMTGFYDQAHLNRLFVKWFAMTPRRFRLDMRAARLDTAFEPLSPPATEETIAVSGDRT